MMEPSFEKLLVLLAEAGVDFVVVGGIAVSIQGYVRLTEDVNILIEDSPENIGRLLERLADADRHCFQGIADRVEIKIRP